jgi:hypothetical protein
MRVHRFTGPPGQGSKPVARISVAHVRAVSGFQALRLSGFQDFRLSGFQAYRISGF